MRIAILGASGLIGHKLTQKLSARFSDVVPVLHGKKARFSQYDLFQGHTTVEGMDVADHVAVFTQLEEIKPQVVLNCAGITKRRAEVNDPLTAIAVNSLFPHRLANWAKAHGVRIIHFSTDCVFDGSEGDYTESSVTTARDAYGQTKALGEIRYDHSLTIRSSFIGRELEVHSELLDWFLLQNGKKIKGFTRALYTGVSTIEMARVVGDLIEHHPEIGGLYQLSVPEPISKYDLLCLARDAHDIDVEIVPDEEFEIKPTLDGSRLRHDAGVVVPTWPEMMDALATERHFYKTLS